LKRSIARVSLKSRRAGHETRPARDPPPAFLFLRSTCQRARLKRSSPKFLTSLKTSSGGNKAPLQDFPEGTAPIQWSASSVEASCRPRPSPCQRPISKKFDPPRSFC